MATWLKNIFYTPVKYGLDGANFLVTKIISAVFNMYGNKLLKTSNDQIIQKNETIDDRNIFYLYPLYLKPLEQFLGANLLEIDNGFVNGLIISVPWKALLSEPTFVTIDNIKLDIIIKNTDTKLNILDNNSYFVRNKDKIVENQNLTDILYEISNLLKQYFNAINIEIKEVDILIGNMRLLINNFIYKNGTINVDKIKIINITDELHLETNQIYYSLGEKIMTIEKIYIIPEIVHILPVFYVNDNKSDFQINISIGMLKMDKITAKTINIFATDKIVVVKNLSSLIVDNVLSIESNFNVSKEDNLLIFDNNTLIFKKSFDIKLGHIKQLLIYFDEIKKLILIGVDKIVNIDKSSNYDKKFNVKNISCIVIYGDDIFELSIENLSIDEHKILSNIKITHNQVTCIFDQMLIVEKGGIVLCKSMLLSDDFDLVTDEIKIIKYNNNLDIHFNHAKVKNLILIINFVTSMINKFTIDDEQNKEIELDLSASISNLSYHLSENNNTTPLNINLHIIESDISLSYENIIFDIIIAHGIYNINNQIATQAVANILMNGYLLAKFNTDKISKTEIIMDNLQIYLDPTIFDKLNYFFGTLTLDSGDMVKEEINISEEGLKQLKDIFSNSVISYHVQDIQDSLNNSVSKIIDDNSMKYLNNSLLNIPTINLLTTSFANLRTAIFLSKTDIDEYTSEQKLTVNLTSIHIYFFDKIVPYVSGKNKPAFISAIFKNIELKQIVENSIKIQKPAIVILEPGLEPRSNEKYKYSLKINTGAIVDLACHDPEWKYFIKFTKENMLNINIITHGDAFDINIITTPIYANIREETLLRLLAFFSNTYHTSKSSKQARIENFVINDIDVNLNFYPIILKQVGIGSNIFTLKDFNIKLSGQTIEYVDSFGNLLTIIGNKWKSQVNPDNLLQFIPNLKLIQPYATPIVNLFNVISHYFNNAGNKKKLRTITKNLNHGSDILSHLVKQGINHVYEFFN